MNSSIRSVKTEIEKAWHCLQCGQTIIPFEKNASAGLLEGVLLLASLGAFCVNLFLGAILFVAFVIVLVSRNGGKKKVCPSCESVNIIPSTSANARSRRKTHFRPV
ncbi:MAG TPA: hypothetical protein VF599_12350 [Pyrinomonadaceae bacterium]|jgi:hypothetical protein